MYRRYNYQLMVDIRTDLNLPPTFKYDYDKGWFFALSKRSPKKGDSLVSLGARRISTSHSWKSYRSIKELGCRFLLDGVGKEELNRPSQNYRRMLNCLLLNTTKDNGNLVCLILWQVHFSSFN
jgi:hypothetical protein